MPIDKFVVKGQTQSLQGCSSCKSDYRIDQ